jgi:hypothetical protein
MLLSVARVPIEPSLISISLIIIIEYKYILKVDYIRRLAL